MKHPNLLSFLLVLSIQGCAINTNENQQTSTPESTPSNNNHIKYHLFTINNGCWKTTGGGIVNKEDFYRFFNDCGKEFGDLSNQNLLQFHSLLAVCGVGYGYSFEQC